MSSDSSLQLISTVTVPAVCPPLIRGSRPTANTAATMISTAAMTIFRVRFAFSFRSSSLAASSLRFWSII